VKRGEVWTAAGGKGYAGKPRPIVIVQDDRFDATASITICAFTSDPTDAPLFRLVVEPSEVNGLETASRLMVDKITTMPKAKLGRRIGRLADHDMVRLNRGLMIFLGLATDATRALRSPSGHSPREHLAGARVADPSERVGRARFQ
jgi:mRNA interferase MazF